MPMWVRAGEEEVCACAYVGRAGEEEVCAFAYVGKGWGGGVCTGSVTSNHTHLCRVSSQVMWCVCHYKLYGVSVITSYVVCLSSQVCSTIKIYYYMNVSK